MKWITVEQGERRLRLAVVRQGRGVWVGYPGGSVHVAPAVESAAEGQSDDQVRAPMTAKVVQLKARAGEAVEPGQLLVVLEAMKMEYRLTAPRAGRVEGVECKEGELVDLGKILVRLA